MRLKYIGPCMDGVYVPAADADVPHGGEIDVDDALGASLLEQPTNWQAVKAAKKSTTTSAEEG